MVDEDERWGEDSDLGTECYGMIERGAAPTYRFHYSSAPYDVESPMHSDAYVKPGSWINIRHCTRTQASFRLHACKSRARARSTHRQTRLL